MIVDNVATISYVVSQNGVMFSEPSGLIDDRRNVLKNGFIQVYRCALRRVFVTGDRQQLSTVTVHRLSSTQTHDYCRQSTVTNSTSRHA